MFPTNYDNPTDAYETPLENVTTYDMPPTTPIKTQRAYSIPELQLPTKRARPNESRSLLTRIFEFIIERKCYFIMGLVILFILMAIVIIVVVLVTRKHSKFYR